jgi:hypothetical protein
MHQQNLSLHAAIMAGEGNDLPASQRLPLVLQMSFEEQERSTVVEAAQDVFLNNFPLREIDNKDIRLICQSYRNENSSLDSCRELFRKYENYFYNWAYVNYFDNLFYFRDEM